MEEYEYRVVEIQQEKNGQLLGPFIHVNAEKGQVQLISVVYVPSRWPFRRGKFLGIARRDLRGPAQAYADEITGRKE